MMAAASQEYVSWGLSWGIVLGDCPGGLSWGIVLGHDAVTSVELLSPDLFKAHCVKHKVTHGCGYFLNSERGNTQLKSVG